MATACRDLLDGHVFKEGHLDWETLPQIVTVAKLPLLATAPRVEFTRLCQRKGVTLATSYRYYSAVGECGHWAHLILVEDISMAELTLDATTPSVDLTWLIDSSCMVEP